MLQWTGVHLPAPALLRIALRDVTLNNGEKITSGERVACLIAPANRDIDVFGEDACEYDLHREIPDVKMAAIPSVSAETGSPIENNISINRVVEAACGQCQFRMTEKSGCDLAVKINGISYFVDGTTIHDHGDAHADDGFCFERQEFQFRVHHRRWTLFEGNEMIFFSKGKKRLNS